MNTPIIIRNIHRILLSTAGPEKRLSYRTIISKVQERVGKLEEQEGPALISELKSFGVINNDCHLGYAVLDL